MDLVFDLDLDFDLDLVGFGLIWVRFRFGFGLIWLGFWSSVAVRALHSSPREVLGRSLGKATRVTRATEVIKCRIEHKIDHLAS